MNNAVCESLLMQIMRKVFELSKYTEHKIYFSLDTNVNTLDVYYIENKKVKWLTDTVLTKITEKNLQKIMYNLQKLEEGNIND